VLIEPQSGDAAIGRLTISDYGQCRHVQAEEEWMANDTLDRLLTTLAVRIHAFAICEIKTGWRLAFDPMDAITIHYVLRGSGSVRVADNMVAAYAPFSVIVVPGRVSQSLGEKDVVLGEASAAENCSLLSDGLVRFTAGDGSRDTLVVCATISASYGGALGLFDHLRGPVIADLSEGETLRSLFALMLGEIAAPGIGTQALIEALMKQCLILLLRHHLLRLGVSSPFFTVLQDHRLARAITSVVEQPSLPHTVDSLASLAGMSRSAFAARFVEAFEQTPIEFVQEVRLRLGAQLLHGTDLPIKLIAASVGYASRSYFTRAFRSVHGIDPRTFRARAARGEQVVNLSAEPSLGDRIVSSVDRILDVET